MRPVFLFLAVLTLMVSCRGGNAPSASGLPGEAPQPVADSAVMRRLAGIWVDAETEAVMFLLRQDSIFYPDTSFLPARFAVLADTMVVYSQDETRYPLLHVGKHTLVCEALTGEKLTLHRSQNPDDSLLFRHRTFTPIILNQKLRRDTVVYASGATRLHLYIDVSPTTRKVYRTTYTDEGMAVDNIYYDNIIHISVYEGRRSLFSHDFRKEEFAGLVPEQFIGGAILSNMEFGSPVREGCQFLATLCEPEGTRCYVVGIVVDTDGRQTMKLIDY